MSRPTITDIYRNLRDDQRLQKSWEQNQPRTDRALESLLIARTPREVATAVLLSVKLRYEPAAAVFLHVQADSGLLSFARTQGSGGARLANLIERLGDKECVAKSASIHSLHFYRNRAADNGLVRVAWSIEGLRAVSAAPVGEILIQELLPPWAERKALGLRELAEILIERVPFGDDPLRWRLRKISGLGPERADAVGVFGFQRGWPIIDEYLWRLLGRHGVLTPLQQTAASYDCRRETFEPYWRELSQSGLAATEELAATLYLWACEAERFGYTYALEPPTV